MHKKEFGLLNLILVVILTSIITSITTGVIIYNNEKNNDLTSTYNNDKDLQEFLSVYKSILDNYYADVNKTKMIDEAISAMMNYLGDDYTTYMNETETEDLAEKLSGTYEGIGVQLIEGNRLYKVFDNTPAKEVGLQEGDIIINVNDTDVTKYAASEIAYLIKSSKDKIIIKVNRNEEELSFSIAKSKLYVPTVDSQVITNENVKTGYISISTFSNTAKEQFETSLSKLENEGIDNLIIDVRDNTGGYLKTASDIASLFLEKGKKIYSLESKDKTEVYKDETSSKKDYKVVVLINGSSASASEILAAALKESYGATLIGEKSYGKGKVQQTHTLDDGSMVKFTSAKWLTPSGNCIDQVGLLPDYEVELTLNEDGITYKDTQLEQALIYLRN